MHPRSSTGPGVGGPHLPPPIQEALDRTRRRRGGFLLVGGASHAARQQLLSRIEDVVTSSDAETVRLRADPLDAIVPYGALQPWLARWYGSSPTGTPPPDPQPRSTGSMPLIGLLLGLPPDGLAPGRPAPGSGSAAGGADPSRTFSPAELRSELLDLVEGGTRRSPAVVLLEDAEFLDSASFQWFSMLNPRLSSLPLLIVCTHAGEGLAWASRLEAPPPAVYAAPPDGVPPWTGETLKGRLRGLPLRSVESLTLVVLGGPDATIPTLRTALEGSPSAFDVARFLDPVVQEALVDRSETAYACQEPTLYPHLLGAVPAGKLVAAHRALALALEARPEGAQGQAIFRLSEHWAEARDVVRGVPSLLLAAREAERWGAPDLASQRLERAVRLAQDEASELGRQAEERSHAELAALHLRAGEPKLAIEGYERALALAKARGTGVVHWGRYVAGIADARASLGEHPEELVRGTLKELGDRAPDVEALLLRSLAFYYIERARFREAIAASEQACAAADRGHDDLLQVQCHSTMARSLVYVGERSDEARAHLLKALEHRKALEGTADQVMVVGLLDGMSLLECGVGNEEASLRWGEEALEMSRRCGYGMSYLWVLGNLAEEHLHVHHLERARVLLEEFRRLVVRLSVPPRDSLHQQLSLLEGRLAFETGDLPGARRHFEQIVKDSEEGGSRVLLAQGLVHLILLELRAGDPAAARGHLRKLERSGLDRSLMGETRRLLEHVRGDLGTASAA